MTPPERGKSESGYEQIGDINWPPDDDYEPPYMGDEPLGTCPEHGDYWTDDCPRCDWLGRRL